MAKTLKIPYGLKDFKTIREEGYYYIDKTAYIRKMEARDRFVFFVRPRRMGKSLFVETLRRYYDVNEKANFRTWFGGLDIGENPTENANRYCVLVLDFSRVGAGGDEVGRGGVQRVHGRASRRVPLRLPESLSEHP